MTSVVRDDRVLPVTRCVAAVIVLALILAVWVLYLQPTETARLWAWTIRPRMTPILMGAGYGAGAYFFVRVLAFSRWHEVSHGFFAITAFTWFMGLATVLHWARFNHGHVAFFAWAGLYFTTPLIVPALWFYNRRTDPGGRAPTDVIVPVRVRQTITAGGLLVLALGLFLFLLPDQAINLWPWKLTPLTSRVIGAFFALSGISGMTLARDPRWSASRIMLESLALGFVLLLIGAARAHGDFDTSNVMTWLYVGGLGVGLMALVALYITMEQRQRQRRDQRTP